MRRRLHDLLAWEPPPRLAVQPVPLGRAGPLRPGAPFTVLCWNLQFCAGRSVEFFYDGGPGVHVDPTEQARTLAAVADVLAQERPDIALLQELDRDSARTQRRDQLQPLLRAVDWACWATTPYHRARFVPVPPPRPLGRIDLHLAVLSRLPLRPGVRIDLPRLDEPRWRQALNLKRALLEMPVTLWGGGELRLGNTHFSAFSRGDGTLGRQVAKAAAWMRRDPVFLLGGDLNLLPPGDAPARLSRDHQNYAERVNPLDRLTSEFQDVSGSAVADPSWRTYLPFGAEAPDRRLDYLFTGSRLEVLDACVLHRYADISDHLPLRATVRVNPGFDA